MFPQKNGISQASAAPIPSTLTAVNDLCGKIGNTLAKIDALVGTGQGAKVGLEEVLSEVSNLSLEISQAGMKASQLYASTITLLNVAKQYAKIAEDAAARAESASSRARTADNERLKRGPF